MLRSIYHALREYYHFYRKEWGSTPNLPLTIRFQMLRRGFLSQSHALYQLAHNNPDDYISDLVRIRMNRLYSIPTPRENYASVLNNKYYSTLVLKQFFHTPDILAYVNRGRICSLVPAWDAIDRQNLPDHIASTGSPLVFKPNAGAEGGGVLIFDASDGTLRRNGTPTSAEAVTNEIGTLHDYLICTYVKQSQFAASLYPLTTNTIRAVTLLDEETGRPYMALAVQRIGKKRSIPVDNWSCGGLSAPIDIETGTIGVAATHPRNEPTVQWYESHPDTGNPIKGQVIPSWPNICASILEAAQRLPFTQLIAWDIVHTDDGMSILEANGTTGVQIFQVHEPLLRRKDIRAFFERNGLFNVISPRRLRKRSC